MIYLNLKSRKRGRKSKILLIIILFSSIDCYSQATFETNIGSERIGVDLISFHYFDKRNRWSLFNRNRFVKYYDKSKRNGFLTINSLAYNFKSGLGLTANLIGDNTRFYPSGGIQYEKTKSNLYFYLLSTYELNRKPFQENYLFIVYKLPFRQKLKIVFHNEFYFSFLNWENDIAMQRIKVGIENVKLQYGIMSETYQAGRHFDSVIKNFSFYIKTTL